jgi:hypothetical protein
MGLRNLKDRIANHPEVDAWSAPETRDTRGGDEVEANEGYLRDALGGRFYTLADFWLIAASDMGDATYVVGATCGEHSRYRQAGIVELIRHSDQSIAFNAIRIDPELQRRFGDEIRGRLGENSNSSVDTVTLAWLSKVVDPSAGAREAGPAAYQEIAAGGRMIYRRTSLESRASLGSV